MTDSIFISIACYRDPELENTIQNCIAKAKFPDNLYFGICWQKDNEILSQNYKNARIYECSWKDSRGACWARSLIQKQLYNNEKYYLQLDSHHRFIDNWDEILIDLYEKAKLKSPKPIIGSYGTTYWKNQGITDQIAYKISTFDSFTNDGDLISRPISIKNQKGTDLIPARLLSGHFIFSDARFIKECPYDPNYYFRGEELTLSARAYTHGYDFFHPTKPIIWHEYLRKENNKHWSDHIKENGFVVEGEERNIKSKIRQRQLFHMEKRDINFKQYDFGSVRSLHEYELYSGINFKQRKVHKYCYDVRGDSPDPYVMTEDEWNSGMLQSYEMDIQWDLDKIPKLDDFDMWFFGFEDRLGRLLYRQDFSCDNRLHQSFFYKKNNRHICTISAETKPAKCIIIPHSRSSGWTERISIPC